MIRYAIASVQSAASARRASSSASASAAASSDVRVSRDGAKYSGSPSGSPNSSSSRGGSATASAGGRSRSRSRRPRAVRETANAARPASRVRAASAMESCASMARDGSTVRRRRWRARVEVRWTFAGGRREGASAGARWAAPRARASASATASRSAATASGVGARRGGSSSGGSRGRCRAGASSEGRRFALGSRSSRASRNAATAATRDEGDDDRATTGARSCASASATGWSARRIDAPTERPSSASVSVAAPALSTGRRTTTPRVSFGAIAGATTSRISISKAHENVAACGAGDEACAPRDASSAAPSSNAASSLRCRTRNGLGSSPAVSLHRSKAKLSLLFQRDVRGVVSIDLPPPRGAPPRDSTRVRSGSN